MHLKPTALLPLILLAGCTLAPSYQEPTLPTPPTWKHQTHSATSSTIPAQWWHAYGSEELNTLQQQAAAANTDIAAAQARIRQSRAALTQATSGLLPTLGASLSTARRIDDNAANTSFSTSAGATLAYEVDIFGGARSARQSAAASLQGTQFNAQATRLAVQGSVVSSYLALLGTRERLALTSESLALAANILSLTELRRQAGVLSDVELTQQRNQVATLTATQAAQAAAVAQAETALAVITGQTPSAFTSPPGMLTSLTLPAVPLQTPAEVIFNRPDIRAAEAALRAANANIGVARAALFPQLSLSLAGALPINPTTPQATLGAGLTAPIFRGGSLLAAVTVSQARKEELLATYRATVLNALKEVEDALAAATALQTQLEQQTIAAENARTTANLAQLRFNAGAINMLELLDAQRTLLSSVSALSQTRQDSLTAATTLIRALGGSPQPQ